jgi:hypothetical protein
MPQRGRTRGRLALRALPILLLAAENVAVFWSHFFRGYGFPWDFTGTYYAAVA